MKSATGVSTRAPIDYVPHEVDRPSNPRILRVAIIWTLIALSLFLLLQTLLAAYNTHIDYEAVDRGMLDEVSYATAISRLFPNGIPSVIAFVTIAVVGEAIASRGHRVLFALPGIAYVFASLAISPHLPHAIGPQWQLACWDWDVTYTTCAMPWFGNAWFGPTVDLALVLVPGLVVTRRVRPHRWPGRTDAAAVAGILTAVALVTTAVWSMSVVQNGVDITPVAAVAVLGLVLGAARPWWPWLNVIVAVALANGFAWLLDMMFWPEPEYPLSSALPYILGDTWPIVAVGLIASLWQPLAWLIRRLQDRPVRLVIAVNALNVADAVLTFLAVRSGGAVESNPFVRNAGLPLKIVFVAALTVIAYRRQPSALVWPFSILLWVAGYHVAGMFVNAWR